MIIRVDKCKTFGIKKVITKSTQYLPKLFINNSTIPTVEIGESFKYLGCYFDFNMTDKDHISELISLIDELMSDIDLKPLHPKKQTTSVQPLCPVKNILAFHCCIAVQDLGNTIY